MLWVPDSPSPWKITHELISALLSTPRQASASPFERNLASHVRTPDRPEQIWHFFNSQNAAKNIKSTEITKYQHHSTRSHHTTSPGPPVRRTANSSYIISTSPIIHYVPTGTEVLVLSFNTKHHTAKPPLPHSSEI